MGEVPAPEQSGEPVLDPRQEQNLESQEDLVHESVELPEWIPVAFGLIVVAIALLAIWTT